MGLLGSLDQYIPAWLADTFPDSQSWGFRIKTVLELMSDAAEEMALEGALAYAGLGTPTALPYLGDERGVVRGRFDTQAQYQVKLAQWIDRAKEKGNAYRLAKDFWEYLGNARVRVITRWGFWIDIALDGTLTTYTATWDWDSVSNPERSLSGPTPYWSDLWVIISENVYPVRTSHFGDGHRVGADGFGVGQNVPRGEADILHLIAAHKAAHSRIRAIIWTSDSAKFNPAVPASMPNGRWGQWSILSSGHQVLGDRDLTTCRFWECGEP